MVKEMSHKLKTLLNGNRSVRDKIERVFDKREESDDKQTGGNMWIIQDSLKPIPPCGACRQAIAEYEIKQDNPIEIYFMGVKGKVVKSKSLANLLPLVFESSVL